MFRYVNDAPMPVIWLFRYLKKSSMESFAISSSVLGCSMNVLILLSSWVFPYTVNCAAFTVFILSLVRSSRMSLMGNTTSVYTPAGVLR